MATEPPWPEVQREGVTMEKPYRDKETLERLYHDELLSQQEIADHFGVSRGAIRKAFDHHGIETRDGSEAMQLRHSKDAPWRDKETLERLHVDEELSAYQIAERLGCASSTADRWLNHHDIERRSKTEAVRLRQGVDRAHFDTNPRGYERARAAYRGHTDTVRLHRLAAVAWFGFDAVVGKVVHHRNAIPWDNRESNLQLLTESEHAAVHNTDSQEVAEAHG